MSIVANTYEEITIRNEGAKTAAFLEGVREYLKAVWGIVSLKLEADGKSIQATDLDTIADDAALSESIDTLATKKDVRIALRSSNNGGAPWRLEQPFLLFLKENPDLGDAISYRSIDYYDCDGCVDTYVFDKHGLRAVEAYTDGIDAVKDIKKWYCETPTISITAEEVPDDGEVHDALAYKLFQLCGRCFEMDEDDIEDALDDYWEDDGEILYNPSASFSTDKIAEIVQFANDIAEIVKTVETAKFEFSITAVPDGADDYDFAALHIEYDGEQTKASACKF